MRRGVMSAALPANIGMVLVKVLPVILQEANLMFVIPMYISNSSKCTDICKWSFAPQVQKTNLSSESFWC